MTSIHLAVKNVALVGGERTTIALEPEFWGMLKTIARAQKTNVGALIHQLDATRGTMPRAAAIRLYIAEYLYSQVVQAIAYSPTGLSRKRGNQAAIANSGIVLDIGSNPPRIASVNVVEKVW